MNLGMSAGRLARSVQAAIWQLRLRHACQPRGVAGALAAGRVAALAALMVTAPLADRPALADIQSAIMSFEQGEFDHAQQELQPLAEGGDPRAQYVLGIIYLHEYLPPPSPTAAVDWIRKAATQGHLQAQTELARMYRTGDGVEQNDAEMVRWYGAAAEQGDVGAQLFLADSYAYGYGVEPDYVQSYMWYEIAIRYWGPLAVRARDMVAKNMTPEQIAKAVRLAGDWLRKNER